VSFGKFIPDFNECSFTLGNGKKAAKILHSTNNFPEFTWKIRPAPLVKRLVFLGINEDPVSIETLKKILFESAFQQRMGRCRTTCQQETGENCCGYWIGGPCKGLAAAQQLK